MRHDSIEELALDLSWTQLRFLLVHHAANTCMIQAVALGGVGNSEHMHDTVCLGDVGNMEHMYDVFHRPPSPPPATVAYLQP